MKKEKTLKYDKYLPVFQHMLEEAKARILGNEPGALTVSISDRNVKMGQVASVSLLPYVTCPKYCRTTCGNSCYACRMCYRRENILKAYARNTAIYELFPEVFWKQVSATLAMNRFFRFHVGGDIPDAAYFDRMCYEAKTNPHCEILDFTKQYSIVNDWLDENKKTPANLHILMSGWDTMKPVNPHHLPESHVIFKNCPIPEDMVVCGGNCENCACRGTGCWRLTENEKLALKFH